MESKSTPYDMTYFSQSSDDSIFYSENSIFFFDVKKSVTWQKGSLKLVLEKLILTMKLN